MLILIFDNMKWSQNKSRHGCRSDFVFFSFSFYNSFPFITVLALHPYIVLGHLAADIQEFRNYRYIAMYTRIFMFISSVSGSLSLFLFGPCYQTLYLLFKFPDGWWDLSPLSTLIQYSAAFIKPATRFIKKLPQISSFVRSGEVWIH